MNNKIWLRSERKLQERRTPLTPTDAAQLISAGAIIHVEDDPNRIFPIADYQEVGCHIEPAHSWEMAPTDFIILGLKEILEEDVSFKHRHIYFAHVFKGQQGWQDILKAYQRDGGSLLDLEYLTDTNNRRIAAFGKWAGFAGAAFALDYFYWLNGNHQENYPKLESFENIEKLLERINGHRESSNKKEPKVIIIGAKGRCGHGGYELFEKFNLNVTQWDYEETKGGGPFPEINEHDIFLNAALIMTKIPPFIDKETLSQNNRQLKIIADVSCDPNSELNPIPVYNQHTSWAEPFLTLNFNGEIHILSVDNLPSTLPRESSTDFSAQLTPHLLDLIKEKGSLTLPFKNALQVFEDKCKEL